MYTATSRYDESMEDQFRDEVSRKLDEEAYVHWVCYSSRWHSLSNVFHFDTQVQCGAGSGNSSRKLSDGPGFSGDQTFG